PSLTQLAAMAREDPDALASVANFKIGRRGIGAVRWLTPTDVRSLNVEGTVALSRGSVEVYLDENEKPEIGEGLNKGAEVTLQKVYRIDKATNRPTTDKDAIARFERKLKKLAADQSARFVSYDADTGTWVFEVEHFSKYGLVDSDDE
ncbi:C-terminal autoproteolytic domain of nucleoporin nup98, partial [Coccomyxa subellipsoidea C-169]